ncbi:hypothetical protein [Streptomyces sp. NPDC002994]|uniref:hypothetical protein n=1 Tax=Streptomyces sp. NPDC002994 TaxID=3154441 RepID=UPI0033B38F05
MSDWPPPSSDLSEPAFDILPGWEAVGLIQSPASAHHTERSVWWRRRRRIPNTPVGSYKSSPRNSCAATTAGNSLELRPALRIARHVDG